MYQRDYFLRMIEQLGMILAKILFSKEVKNYEQAQNEIDNAFKNLLKFDPDAVTSKSEKALIEMIRSGGEPAAERFLVMAELTREYAELLELRQTFPFTVTDLYVKSFALYLEFIDGASDIDTSKYLQTLLEIEKKLQQEDLPLSFKSRLFRFNELIGDYAKAEDILFDILKTSPDEAKLLGEGFYDRLLQKSPQELEAGNLPYHEALEGMKTLQDRLDKKTL
jgi:hypothetical protein